MNDIAVWILIGLVGWLFAAVVVGLGIGRMFRCRDEQMPRDFDTATDKAVSMLERDMRRG